MRDKLSKMLQDGWSEPNALTYILLPLTMFYRCMMCLRKFLYSQKILTVYRSKLPVIVVGNISVGGTGKTPLTMAIVAKARKMGFKPGVISRGYGGQALEWPQMVHGDTNAYYVGDEAVLIAKNTQCPVAVGPKRGQTIELLRKNSECDLIISDDGLQHYALSRDVEIAVIDQQRRHLNQYCLPSGPLREPESRLKSVDLIMNHVAFDSEIESLTDSFLSADFQESSDAKFYLKVNGFVSILGEDEQKLETSQVLHAVAGIGHPVRFFRLLTALGYEIIEHAFPDHHRYNASDFDFGDDAPVVMTGKDAVKCLACAKSNWYFLSVEARLNAIADERLEQILSELKKD
jgi:tetraacyldisaccharide 4'-kinase